MPDGKLEFCVLKREPSDRGGYWQWVAGGGEEGETPEQTARRETLEETGISADSALIRLDSMTTVPATEFGSVWGESVLVVPEYAFGIQASTGEIKLSSEHTEYRWVDYETASGLLKWDSNRNALWELDLRLRRKG
jgi:dATP pyrophosphohydrolase